MIGFVYVIGSQDNPVKVGHAERTDNRLSQLNVGNPDPLVLHHRVGVPWRNVRDVEKLAHRMLEKHHRRGEWYNVSAAHALEVIESAKATILSSNDNELMWMTELEEIMVGHEMSPWAPHAMNFYQQNARRLNTRRLTLRLHAVIRLMTGNEGLIAFRVFTNKRSDLMRLRAFSPAEYRRATAATAAAINALSDYYRRKREAILLDEIRRNAA
jgi:hypothetical protein